MTQTSSVTYVSVFFLSFTSEDVCARRTPIRISCPPVNDPGGSGQQAAGFEGEPDHALGRITAGTSAAAQTRIWRAEFAYGRMSTTGWDSQTGPGADG